MKPCSNYKKGDIILIRFPFTNASELKVRPALVMRDQTNQKLTLLPISTKINLHQTDLIIEEKNYEHNPLPVESVIRISKITTVQSERAIKKVSKLNPVFFKEVQSALFQYLD